MGKAKLNQKLAGEYGHFNADASVASSDYTIDKFDARDEVDEVFTKAVTHRSNFNLATPATETDYICAFNRAKRLKAAKLIPVGAYTADTDNYFAYVIQEGTDSLVTAISTATETFTAGTAVEFTLGTDVEIAADAVISLKRTETGTVPATDDVQVQVHLEFEDAETA